MRRSTYGRTNFPHAFSRAATGGRLEQERFNVDVIDESPRPIMQRASYDFCNGGHEMMEDGLGAQNHSGQLGPSGSGINIGVKQNHEEHNQRVQYSIPGILHFIQHEWARFEMERSQWEVERAELQARIAFLQGERKGQENLKNDLVRRIKMLEYALKQERAKYHKLKYGTDLNQGEIKPPVFDDINRDEPMDGETLLTPNSNVTWRQGRQLLRQYLQEIGYTDTIIDVRSARVRSLLGLAPSNGENEENHNSVPAVNGEQTGKRASEQQGRRTPAKKIPPSIASSTIMDTEESVLATFDFLARENVDMDEDEDNLSDEMEEGSPDDEADERIENRRVKQRIKQDGSKGNLEGGQTMDDVLADAETEDVLSEFAFLSPDGGEGAGEARSQGGEGTEWEKEGEPSSGEEWAVNPQIISKLKEQYRKERKSKKGNLHRPKRSALQAMLVTMGNQEERLLPPQPSTCHSAPTSLVGLEETGIQGSSLLPFSAGSRRPLLGPGTDDDAVEAALGLGELAGLTVNNEADVSYDITATKEAFRKTWNAKYTLRSHFDGVRALAFHPVEPVLITASEDHTLKLWNLQKTVPAKKTGVPVECDKAFDAHSNGAICYAIEKMMTKRTASLDVEPVYTFRAHIGPVLCLAMSPTGEQCFSGGMDSTIRCWNIPSSNIDPYDSFVSPRTSFAKYLSVADPGVLTTTLTAHSDAVWDLSIHSSNMQLLSCSADGTVRLWGPHNKTSLLNTYVVDTGDGTPTSVDFVHSDPALMVTAFTSSNCIIYDLETGKPVVRLDNNQNSEVNILGKQINRVVSHPTLPVTITAHEDRHIRFFDNNTGKMVHSMVAHLDAVTCLAIDPNGLYLLSGSHDCSIRLWNLDNKSCVQEITSHRKKFDESIFDVAFHPSKPFIASAGADALAKVFV